MPLPLAAVLAAAILSASPATPKATAARLGGDMAASSSSLEEGLMLVVTAKAESDFRQKVEQCTVVGDHGAALSIYQLHAWHYAGHSQEEICASNRLATKLAARALSRIRRVAGSVREAFMRYVGTNREDDRRVLARLALFDRLSMEASRAVE